MLQPQYLLRISCDSKIHWPPGLQDLLSLCDAHSLGMGSTDVNYCNAVVQVQTLKYWEEKGGLQFSITGLNSGRVLSAGALLPWEEVRDMELDGRVSECQQEGCGPIPRHGSHEEVSNGPWLVWLIGLSAGL